MNSKPDRKPISILVSFLIVLLVLSCASLDYSNAPECAVLESQAPLPDLSCAQSPASVVFTQNLSGAMGRDLGSLLVRATLDEQSRVTGLCVDGQQVPGGFRRRANLSARYLEFAAIDGGPECLAGRRIDLNRRKAKQALIKRRTAVCKSQIESVRVTRQGPGASQVPRREFENCLDFEASWLTLHQVGRQQPYIFGRPEVVDPPAAEASATRTKCNRKHKNGNPDDIVACIIADGWELLE